MKRELYLVFLLALVPSIVNALGLGKLDLNSALNEPFEAKIQLLSPTADELNSLNVALADSEAFARAKLDRLFVLSNLKFVLRRSIDDDSDYIHVFSKEPIREPFLNFLVEVSWSNGRLYREYTVLLDPPLYDPSARRRAAKFKKQVKAQGISPAEQADLTTDAPDDKVVDADDFEQDRNAVSSSPSPQIDYSGGDYGPTFESDTLWSIASAMRPDSSISVNQMMLALFRINPDAFINQNINGLKRGQILRMPDESEINTLNNAQVMVEVQSQHAAWDGFKDNFSSAVSERPGSSSVPETTAIDVVVAATTTPKIVEADPELKLVTANDTNDVTQQVASVNDGSSEDLILAQESIQALTQENIELKDQMQESEALLQDLKRLLSLKDDELATLQEQMVAASVDILEEESVDEVTVEEATKAIEEQPAQDFGGTTGMVEQYLGFIKDMILGNFIIIIAVAVGGVLVVLILIVILMKFRKGSAETVHTNSSIEESFPDFDSGDTGNTGEGVSDSEALTVLPGSENETEIPADAVESDLEIEKEALAIVEEAPDEDPLQEINTYLAFEQFDKAEELARNAINDEPDNPEYHIKLLEVFYTSGNKNAYEEAAKVLSKKVGSEGEHWNMVVAMWQEMSPNRVLFEVGEDEKGDVADNTGGFVDVTADEKAADDNVEGLDFDMGDVAEEVLAAESAGDDGVLDIYGGSGDDLSGEDLLDVTATANLESDIEEDLLDVTATANLESDIEEDLLDVTATANLEPDIEKDLLDVTATANLEPDIEKDLLDVTAGTSTGDDNVIDFDMTNDAAGLEVDLGKVEEPIRLDVETKADSDDEFSLDFDMSEMDPAQSSKDEISLDLDTGKDKKSEISMDINMEDDSEIGLDLSEAVDDLSVVANETPELDISLDMDGLGKDFVESDTPEMDFDLSFDDDDFDLDDTVEIPKEALDSAVDESAVDEDDATVFIPKTAQSDKQSVEDEITTKLDLAKAYVELGDKESAKKILDEVMVDGNDEQKKQAEELLGQV